MHSRTNYVFPRRRELGMKKLHARALILGWAIASILATTTSLPAAETISGRVTRGATGLIGIDLDVFDTSENSVAVTGDSTDGSGFYQLTVPSPGDYLIRADASQIDGVADLYYNQQFLRSNATTITVPSNSDVPNINFNLPTGFDISGTIRAGGFPLSNIDIDVFAANGDFLSGYPGVSIANGTYSVGALPPGSYLIKADPDPALGQFYEQRFFGGDPDKDNATPIVITASDRTGIDIDLVLGGLITGTIISTSSGLPLDGIDLDLFDALGDRVPQGGKSQIDGTYTLGPVPKGTYFLRADPLSLLGWPRVYYDGISSVGSSTPISVLNVNTTPGINFSLSPGGTISGRITDAMSMANMAGVDLDGFDSLGRRVDPTALSAIDGTYTFGPLPPGSYFLKADPSLMQGSIPVFYDGQIDMDLAQTIVVTEGANTPNIDFALTPGGQIQGTITDSMATPLAGIDLDIFDFATKLRVSGGAKTLMDGTYAIGPIPGGNYIVRADPTVLQGFAVEYFDDRGLKSLADMVVVTVPAATTNIDFALQLGGSISGTVISQTTGAPIVGMDMDVLIAGTFVRLDASDSTDINGDFALGPFPPGTYLIRADPDSMTQPYKRTYYGQEFVKSRGAEIPIVAGQMGTGFDVEMPDFFTSVRRLPWELLE